jgi:hypothetical protein
MLPEFGGLAELGRYTVFVGELLIVIVTGSFPLDSPNVGVATAVTVAGAVKEQYRSSIEAAAL